MHAKTRPAPWWKRLALAAVLFASVLPLTACAEFSPAFYACLLSGTADADVCRGELLAPGPPAAPADVDVELVSANEDYRIDVVWTWPPEPDAESVRVYRARTSGGPYVLVGSNGFGGTTFWDTLDDDADGERDFDPCTTLYYVVTAVDSFGQESPHSAEVSAPLPCAGLAVPTRLRATARDRRVALSWRAPVLPGVLGYDVYRVRQDPDPAIEDALRKVNAELVTSLEYSDEELRNDLPYHYRVVAIYGDGRSGLSGLVAATPAAELQFDWELTADVALSDAVRLEWTSRAPQPFWASFVVYRSKADEWSFTRMPGFQRPFATDHDLETGTEYVYKVTIEFTNGEEYAPSELVSVTPYLDPNPFPDAPTGLAAIPGDGTVRLSWFDNPEADLAGYNVERADAAGGPFARLNTELVTASDYVVEGLENGREHFFRVTAVNLAGRESEPSVVASAIPRARPPAPTGLTATPGPLRIALDWAAGTGLAGYNVYQAEFEDGPWTLVNFPLVAAPPYTVSGLVAGRPYFFRITAVDPAGTESLPSEIVSARPLAATPAPATPTGLTASPGDHLVALDWADNTEPDLAGYTVYLATDAAGPFSVHGRGLVTVSQRTVADLPTDRPFFFRVTAVDTDGNESPPSATVSATACPAACLGALASLRRPAAAAAKPATARFGLTVAGAFDDGGASRVEGDSFVGTGFGFTGTFVLEPALKGLDPRLKELARAGLGGSWRALVDWRLSPAAGTAATTGIALATFADARVGVACLRFEESAKAKRRGAERRVVTHGTFAFLGGTGEAAKLLGGGSYSVEAGADGSLRYDGRATPAAGDLPLPPECVALGGS